MRGTMEVYWLEQNETDLPQNDAWLSDKEQTCLAGMRIGKRKADWRLGRWTAKSAVAAFLNQPNDFATLRNIEIRAAVSGAPEVFIAGRTAPVVISLSHRCDQGFCTVSERVAALGCDVELVEPREGAFLGDYFTPEEQRFVMQAPASGRPQIVALLWSAKESALKALSAGLRLDTRSVIVTLQEAPGAQVVNKTELLWHPLRVCHVHHTVFQGWWRIGTNFVHTVVAEPAASAPISLLENHPAACPESHKSEARLDIVADGEILSSAPIFANDNARD